MERQIPKNVRQIGNVSDNPKIYVEDYVDTFLVNCVEKCKKPEIFRWALFWWGHAVGDSGDYVYIYGAVRCMS